MAKKHNGTHDLVVLKCLQHGPVIAGDLQLSSGAMDMDTENVQQ